MAREFLKNGYWALILGGSSGLGLATARKLAKNGMNIIIVHRSLKSKQAFIEEAIASIKKEKVQCLAYNQDALNPDKRKFIIQDIKAKIGNGTIRVLIHSIAKGNLKPMIGQEKVLGNQDFHLTIEAMAISLYDWVQAVYDEWLFDNDSRVLSYTSEGSTKAWANYAAVSAAKAALEAITRNIALEYAPYGIRANCIQAGVVDTDSLRLIPGHEQLIEKSIERNPFKRLTKPSDVANIVYLLCKDEAAWINGCTIPVNGGGHLQ